MNKRGQKRLPDRTSNDSMSATDIGDILAMVRDIKEYNTRIESKLLELDEKVKHFELMKAKVDQVVKGVHELKERDRSLKLAEIDAKDTGL